MLWKGLGADSEEKHEPASGVDTELVDSLKALDPERPRLAKRTLKGATDFATVKHTALDLGRQPHSAFPGVRGGRSSLQIFLTSASACSRVW